MDTQIDLEEAIAASKPTVRQFAGKIKISEWRVRKAIQDGHLIADTTKRPMVIEGGEMPLTTKEWQAAIGGAVDRIKPSVRSWSENGRSVQILTASGEIATFSICLTKFSADQQAREIDRLRCKRVGAEAAE